ncbi:MAG: efflux RND transporter periplasmic adaptor subunit [bacterium]|nr:efflux RND transporter periplasmic adaptor subunit [Gammaproteobacteria bacterium]HIL98526.1 efflux RND transporter periplasmic adaptor subunit [Pseudomonadales bacterium]
MNDKRELLGELQIDAAQREVRSHVPRLLVTGIGAIVLALAAWFWLLPDHQPIMVAVAKAENAGVGRPVEKNTVLDASGYVTARRKATVSSKFTGKVVEVFVEEGVVVTANQLLARLDNSSQLAQFNLAEAQIKATQSRLAEIRVLLQEARLALTRTVELSAKNLASQADLDRTRLAVAALAARLAALHTEVEVGRSQLEVQQQFLDDTEIRAPFGGVVIAKSAQPGEMISPISAGGGFTRTGICTIVDMDSLEIEVDVNESYINRVTSGQPVTATLNSYQDWKIPARVITIIPTADRNKATVRVRIAFLQTDARILPDMGVKVSFMEEPEVLQDPGEQLVGVFVPASSLATIADNPVVFVVSNDMVEVRRVTVGQQSGSSRNIISGLKPGEMIVENLSDELSDVLTEGRAVQIQ